MQKASHPPIIKTFSRKVIDKRYSLKISQYRLSLMTDCHINTIKKLEKGTATPNLVTSIKIAKALQISLDELLATLK